MNGDGLRAALWGLVAGSAFVLGGFIGLRFRPSNRVIGLLTAFGAGALLAAVAYELVDEAGKLAGGSGRVGIGLIVGSLLYLIATGQHSGDRLPIAPSFRSLAVIVVPEAIVIVGSLLAGHHIGAAMIIAVFLCGVPEAFGATGNLTRAGLGPPAVMLVWCGMALVCGVAAGISFVLLDGAPERLVAFVLAAAGGAVLTELTTELIPEARALAGPHAGPVAVIAFGMVFGLIELV